jgi:hypothetical protein
MLYTTTEQVHGTKGINRSILEKTSLKNQLEGEQE